MSAKRAKMSENSDVSGENGQKKVAKKEDTAGGTKMDLEGEDNEDDIAALQTAMAMSQFTEQLIDVGILGHSVMTPMGTDRIASIARDSVQSHQPLG